MVRKYIMIPIEYAENFLDFVCNYKFKKGENKDCKCYGKLYRDNLCKTHYKISNRNIDNKRDNKSILIKSNDKIIEDSKKFKLDKSIYKKVDEKEVIDNNNIEKIERNINTFKNFDITKIKEFMPKDYNNKKEIKKCKIYYNNKRCISNLKGKYIKENVCKFHLENFCIICERPLTKCKCKNVKENDYKNRFNNKKALIDNFTYTITL